MPRTARLFPLLLLAGCGPATPMLDTVPRPAGTFRVETSEGAIESRIDPSAARARTAVVPLASARAWAALPAAYTALGLPAGQGGEAEGASVVGPLQLMRRLDRVPLSRYLDCGSTVALPNADAYAVTLHLATQLEPAGAGATRVATLVQASARPRDTAGNPVSCTSTGLLEQRLAEELQRAGQ